MSTIDLWKEMFKDFSKDKKKGKPTLNIEINDLQFDEPDLIAEKLH